MCQVGALIVSPTRELARQIWTVAEPFVQSVPGTTCQLLVGGTYVGGVTQQEGNNWEQPQDPTSLVLAASYQRHTGQRHPITIQA